MNKVFLLSSRANEVLKNLEVPKISLNISLSVSEMSLGDLRSEISIIYKS